MAKKKSRFKQFAKGAALGAAEQSAEEIEQLMNALKGKKKKNGGGGGLADPGSLTQFLPFLAGSDPAMKENVKLVGESPSGLNVYQFTYKPGLGPEGVYEGVMSNEIPSEAVLKVTGEFDRVFYNKIDVEFKKVKEN